MRLTYYTDYALRLLLLLALEPEQRHTIEAAAVRFGVSKNHLMKVAMTLTQAGLIESTRGRGGGLKLAHAAGDIRLGDAVRATERDFHIAECLDAATNSCSLSPACRLKSTMQEAVSEFLAVFDRYTVADLVRSPAANRRMLQSIPLKQAMRRVKL